MPGHARQVGPFVQPRGHVGTIALQRREHVDVFHRFAEDSPVHLTQQGRLVIGGAAQHDAVQLHAIGRVQMRLGLVQIADPAVDADGQMRPLALQTPHQGVVQRRHVAVLLGRQPLQPGLARMDDEVVDAHGGRGVDRGEQAFLRVLIVDADAAFDRGGHADRRLDRRHAVGHQLRLAHQAGAELARLHPIRRAAHVQVDLVIAIGLADPRRLGQLGRVRAAQLQRHRMLDRVEAQQAVAVAVDDRRGRDHLRIEQRPRAQRAVKRSTVAVGPVHHRRHGQPMRLFYRHLFSKIKTLNGDAGTRVCDVLRRFPGFFDTSVPTESARNDDYAKLPSGPWRVQTRRRWRYIGESILKRDDARLPAALCRSDHCISLGSASKPRIASRAACAPYRRFISSSVSFN
ncbi:hypothetical protein D3C77_256990 [compost metagenome]